MDELLPVERAPQGYLQARAAQVWYTLILASIPALPLAAGLWLLGRGWLIVRIPGGLLAAVSAIALLFCLADLPKAIGDRLARRVRVIDADVARRALLWRGRELHIFTDEADTRRAAGRLVRYAVILGDGTRWYLTRELYDRLGDAPRVRLFVGPRSAEVLDLAPRP